jgi:superfamily II DNA or RNA helicase
MICKLSNSLKIYQLNTDQQIIIEKGLSLKNPAYDVMVRHKNIKALYVIKEYIKYFKKIDGGLEVGRGVLPRIIRNFPGEPAQITYNLCDNQLDEPLDKNVFQLRDYQEGVIEKIIKHNEGVIKLDTGFGKTLIALKLIEETNLKTLIICPRLSIVSQFVSDLKKYYGYEAGIISGSKWDTKDITVASVQTLKMRDLKDIKNYFGMCIWDECHTAISEKGIKIITSFNPERLYGMSASPDRSDGQGEAIKFYFGDIIVDRELPQIKPIVQIVKCHEDYSGIFDKSKEKNVGDEYHSIIENQTTSVGRNMLIADIANKELSYGRKILILTKRVSHYEAIINIFSNNIKCYAIRSGLNTAELSAQNELLETLRNGSSDFDIIFGTFSMLSTGVNIPALDTLIIAGDLRSDVLSKQSVGRILRLFEGKKDPKIIDIDDVGSGILHNQARCRKKFYKNNNFTIL